MAENRSVCIVTDSTSDIPGDIVADLGITVVPLSVAIGGETFFDGDISIEEFFRRMKASKELPKTSQPSVGAFEESFRACLERCSEVVCVTISNRLSGTFESATEAARSFGDRVHVLDTLNLSWAEGYQVVQTARAAARGATVPELKARFDDLRGRVHMVVGLDSLENLAKGGRIGKVSAMLGGLLNLKVLLTVDADGSFIPVARIRGTKDALRASIEWIAGHIDEKKPAHFAVQHAMSQENANWLEAAIRERFTVGELLLVPAGAVISAHTGTGWGLTVAQHD